MNNEQKPNYVCPTCRANDDQTGEIRTAGGSWSSIFDFDTERYCYVSCATCRYPEFYRTRLAHLSSVVDVLVS